jgi:hypothetical protein
MYSRHKKYLYKLHVGQIDTKREIYFGLVGGTRGPGFDPFPPRDPRGYLFCQPVAGPVGRAGCGTRCQGWLRDPLSGLVVGPVVRAGCGTCCQVWLWDPPGLVAGPVVRAGCGTRQGWLLDPSIIQWGPTCQVNCTHLWDLFSDQLVGPSCQAEIY